MGSDLAPRSWVLGCVVCAFLAPLGPASAQDTALSDRAKGLDANANGVIDRDEARGPLAANFDAMDCNKSGSLDGAEIRWFFRDGGCPKKAQTASAPPKPRNPKALSPRAAASDANENGVLERDEAGGPLAANFDKIDTDKSGTLDGAEIRAFFTGGSRGTRSAGRRSGGRPPARVVLDAVVTEPVSQTFPVIGRLVARQSGVIASQIAGALIELRVNVGDRVDKDQIIAVISKDRLASERDRYAAAVGRFKGMVATAQAEYAKKRRELRRLERLKKSAAFSRARFEDLERDVQSRRGSVAERQAQLKEAEAQLRRAEIDLRDTEIRAPFPGVVSEKHTDVGTYLRVADRIVTVINDRDIEIETEVPSDRLQGVKIGRKVNFRLDDGTRHQASVRAIVPQENLRTRTRPIRFTPDFNGISKELAVNQSLTVDIPLTAADNVVTVHKDAIVRSGTKSFVYVVKGNVARRKEVSLGDAVGARFVVLGGVKAGEKVVVRGNETLGRGGLVQVVGSTGG